MKGEDLPEYINCDVELEEEHDAESGKPILPTDPNDESAG